MDRSKSIAPEEQKAHIEKTGAQAPVSPHDITAEELRELTERAQREAKEAWEKLTPEERARAEAEAAKLMEKETKKLHEEMEKAAEFRRRHEAERAPRPKFCTNCGAPVSGGNFCTECGHML